MKTTIILLILTAIIFAIGYAMPEYYTINGTDTHMLGLKFIPPCTPLFGNATCGYDLLFNFYLAFVFLVIIFDLKLYYDDGVNK